MYTTRTSIAGLAAVLVWNASALAQPVTETETAATSTTAATPAAPPLPKQNGRFVRGAGESVMKIRQGKKRGDMGFKPYSGSYLPRSSGPLANSESDAEIRRMVTDGFNNGECNLVHQVIKDNAKKDTAAKFEAVGVDGFRERYLREGYDKEAESWTGFCHNWAPAGLDQNINFIVSMDKIYADVPFGIADMRELMTFNFPDSWNVAWFGKRHNDKDSEEKIEDSLDPVDLITILDNYVDEGKPGIVLDVDPGYMVWNQPVYKWDMETKRIENPAEFGPKRPPEKGRVYKVKINATYGLEGHYGYRGDTIERTTSWDAYLYTDKKGNIVDSAWDGSNRIPDFAWIPRAPSTNAEFEKMKKIAEEGISVKDIEEFCRRMAALPNGRIKKKEAQKLSRLLDKICPVLDQNKLADFIRKTAERTGQDYSVLDGMLHSETPAHEDVAPTAEPAPAPATPPADGSSPSPA